MAKSKHPGLLEKATDDLARINKEVKREAAALKDFAKACESAGKLATSSSDDYSTQYDYLAKLIEKYGTSVAQVIDLERQQDEAKGDKKKEKEVKKKFDKAEKEATALRKEYNLAGEVYSTLSGLIDGEIGRLQAAAGKLKGFSK